MCNTGTFYTNGKQSQSTMVFYDEDTMVTYTNTNYSGEVIIEEEIEKPKRSYSVIKQKNLINRMSINKNPHRIVRRNYLTLV